MWMVLFASMSLDPCDLWFHVTGTKNHNVYTNTRSCHPLLWFPFHENLLVWFSRLAWVYTGLWVSVTCHLACYFGMLISFLRNQKTFCWCHWTFALGQQKLVFEPKCSVQLWYTVLQELLCCPFCHKDPSVQMLITLCGL